MKSNAGPAGPATLRVPPGLVVAHCDDASGPCVTAAVGVAVGAAEAEKATADCFIAIAGIAPLLPPFPIGAPRRLGGAAPASMRSML